MATLNIRCARCQRILEVHRSKAGSHIACPHCRQTLMVPIPPGVGPKASPPQRRAAPRPQPRQAPAPRPQAAPRRRVTRKSSSGMMVLVLLLIVLGGGGATAYIFIHLSEQERTHVPVIKEGFQEIVDAVNAGDADRLAALFDTESANHRSRLREKYRAYFRDARMEITDAEPGRVRVDGPTAVMRYSLTNHIKNTVSRNERTITRENATMEWHLVGGEWTVYEPDLAFILPE